MSELQPQATSEFDLTRRQVIDSITEATASYDFQRVNELAEAQKLLRPYEIVEYMDVMRRYTDDPIEFRNWADALNNYTFSLTVGDFPEEEVQIIDSVTDRLDSEAIILDPKRQPPKKQAYQASEAYDANWDSTRFLVSVPSVEAERVTKMPVFKMAKEYALSEEPDEGIRDAVELVTVFSSGQTKTTMLTLLDRSIDQRAVQLASGALPGYSFPQAITLINEYASNPIAASVMRACLDKYVYKLAAAYASGTVPKRNKFSALALIDEYVSSELRRTIMRHRLKQ